MPVNKTSHRSNMTFCATNTVPRCARQKKSLTVTLGSGNVGLSRASDSEVPASRRHNVGFCISGTSAALATVAASNTDRASSTFCASDRLASPGEAVLLSGLAGTLTVPCTSRAVA